MNIFWGWTSLRNYMIYLIRKPLSIEYYGKEQKIYELVREYTRSNSELKKIIEKQIEFISEPIPLFELYSYIKENNAYPTNYIEESEQFSVILKDEGTAYLTINPKELILSASGTIEAETTFFELLRKFRSTFLAIDVEHNRFGWLRPITQQSYI